MYSNKLLLLSSIQIVLLKRAINKFKSQISDGQSSSNDTVHSFSASSGRNIIRDRLLRQFGNQNSRVSSGAAATRVMAHIMEDEKGPQSQPQQQQPEEGSKDTGSRWKRLAKRASSQNLLASSSAAAAAAVPVVEVVEADKDDPEEVKSADRKKRGAPYLVKSNPTWARPSTSSASTPPSALASTMMHDFSLSMSEYRGEMNENMGRLNDKINRLEGVITNLSDKIPDLVQEINRKLLSANKAEREDDDNDVVAAATGS